MDTGIFDRKLGSVELNVYRAQPLDPERAAAIAGAILGELKGANLFLWRMSAIRKRRYRR
jgi:hypothetical protein